MPDDRVEFGLFVFDRHSGMLSRSGSPVPLSTRGTELLRALLDADGQVVTKSQLMDAAWPNASIEESNLTVQIAALRKSLGALPNGQEWIATAPRVGYRLVRSDADVASPKVDAATMTGTRKPSIAVLPFTNMSSDPEQDYFAAGIAEDLITDLSKVPGLVVIARNSSFAYSGKPADVRAVAKELGVRYVVEGSVRRAADRVRINAELIDAIDNSHLWADRFDRNLADVFELQDEVVGRIVNALAGALPSAWPIASRRTTNLEAYDLFVRGRVLVMQSPQDNGAARLLLQKSTELDPSFAEAHAWLALSDVWGWVFYGEDLKVHNPLARAAVQRAVSLDPNDASAHWILGYVLAYDGELAKGVAGGGPEKSCAYTASSWRWRLRLPFDGDSSNDVRS